MTPVIRIIAVVLFLLMGCSKIETPAVKESEKPSLVQDFYIGTVVSVTDCGNYSGRGSTRYCKVTLELSKAIEIKTKFFPNEMISPGDKLTGQRLFYSESCSRNLCVNDHCSKTMNTTRVSYCMEEDYALP